MESRSSGTSSVVPRSNYLKDSTSSALSLAGTLQTLCDGLCASHVTMTYEEALGLWVSCYCTCTAYNSSPIWKGGIPSLYLYSGFLASSGSWSDKLFSFRGFLDGATQLDFGGSAWPPTLLQALIGQDGATEYTEFVEYVSSLPLTTFCLKYALSSCQRRRVGEACMDFHTFRFPPEYLPRSARNEATRTEWNQTFEKIQSGA